MSIDDFNNLSMSDRLYHTMSDGVYLDKHFTISSETQLISIYSYKNYYVEIIFSIKQCKILDVIAFREGDNFDKYTYFLLRGILD